jgi:REP element-mobilizing transposase RayT
MKSDPRLVISTSATGTGLKLSGQDLHRLNNRPKNRVHSGIQGYFITFRCYGSWLHGDQRGSIDWRHRTYKSPLLERDQERERREFKALKHSAVLLDGRRRMIVEVTIREVAEHRTWIVHALAVRSNHVHVVVTAEITPENVMNSFKSWATRRMVEAGALPKGTKTWSRHGSTGYLWTPAALEAACRYVKKGQESTSLHEPPSAP